jgi:hypothetical protein
MAMTNIEQKKMMQYFPDIQVFVCCLWSGFCTAAVKKIETDWFFFQLIYLGIDHDHLMFYLNL